MEQEVPYLPLHPLSYCRGENSVSMVKQGQNPSMSMCGPGLDTHSAKDTSTQTKFLNGRHLQTFTCAYTRHYNAGVRKTSERGQQSVFRKTLFPLSPSSLLSGPRKKNMLFCPIKLVYVRVTVFPAHIWHSPS